MVYSCIGVDATFVIYQCNYNEEPEISRTVYQIDLHRQELFTQINQISASMLMPPKGTVTGCNFVNTIINMHCQFSVNLKRLPQIS